jgi:hypothetical protein
MSWAQVVRDVLVASMNKGQFPLAIVALIVLTLIIKLPPEDVSRLVFAIIDLMQRGYFVGYAGFLLATGGWFFHAKWQRRIIQNEIDRLSAERTSVQEGKLGNKIKSSEVAK